MIRAFEDVYGNLEGRRLEALARLFAQNVRIYVYPMTATDLGEWLKSVSITGWETETNGWVSASQLQRAALRTSIRSSSPATFLSLCESPRENESSLRYRQLTQSLLSAPEAQIRGLAICVRICREIH